MGGVGWVQVRRKDSVDCRSLSPFAIRENGGTVGSHIGMEEDTGVVGVTDTFCHNSFMVSIYSQVELYFYGLVRCSNFDHFATACQLACGCWSPGVMAAVAAFAHA